MELPSLPPKAHTTGSREHIDRMRELLTHTGVKLAPFIEVNGIVDAMNQEFVLCTEASFREVGGISKTEGFYNNFTFSIEGKDIATGHMRKGSAKVVAYRGAERVVIIDKDLGWEPEPGKAKFTLTKETTRDVFKGVIGYHVYGHRHQVLSLGEGIETNKSQGKLSGTKNYYVGFRIEFRHGEDYVGWQRIHEYLPYGRRVILKASIKIVPLSVGAFVRGL